MSQKPCARCGQHKKPGHPLFCWECWLPRQPMTVQLAECRASAARADLAGRRFDRVSPKLWPEGRRWCAGCQRFRRLEMFGSGAARCKPCAWEQSHEATVKRVYGLEAGSYEAMMEAQGGRCAICRNRQLMRALAVHHDHATGAVVALLCSSCNHDLLGGAWDSPELLLRAWAVQVRGWPLAQEVISTGRAKLEGQPMTWPVRLHALAYVLENLPDLVPVERPGAGDPPPF